MLEIKREVVRKDYEVVYVANDGTEFQSSDECRKYESTAKCVLFSRYGKLVVKSSNTWDVLQTGTEDEVLDVIRIKNTEDANLVLQLFNFVNGYDADYGIDILERAMKEEDFVFIYRGYDKECFNIRGTRNGLIEKLQGI